MPAFQILLPLTLYHHEMSNQSQLVWKGITLFIKIQPRGLLHTLNTDTVTYKEKSGFFFLYVMKSL